MDRCLCPDREFLSIKVHADNIQKKPDRLVLNNIRTDRRLRQRTVLFQNILMESRQRTGSRQNKSGDKHWTAFFKSPDRIRTAAKIETDRIRMERHRTESPERIWTVDRHRTQKIQKKKNETRTGHEHCCLPTSGNKDFLCDMVQVFFLFLTRS